jgi:hypothetical protein
VHKLYTPLSQRPVQNSCLGRPGVVAYAVDNCAAEEAGSQDKNRHKE